MGAKKFYQTFKLSVDNEFIVEFGNAQKETPQIICIIFKTYLTSLKDTYEDIIDEIMLQFKKRVNAEIKKSTFDNAFIFDFDFLKMQKKEFKNKILTFDLFLKQNIESINQTKYLHDELKFFLEPLLKDLETTFVKHNISPKKVKIK